MPKKALIATRIIVVVFGFFFIAGAILHICDPSLGYSTPHYPTRKQAALNAILPSVYAVFLFIPPSVLSQKLRYLLSAGAVRGIGCASVLFGVAKIVWQTNGDIRQLILTLIFTGILLVAPALLAVVELLFQQNIRQPNV